MEADIGTHAERWLLSRLDAQPWREALASTLAVDHPELYARVTDPGPASVVTLLEVSGAERCLDATGDWGQIAIPLARRAHVVALSPSPERAAIVHRIAAQEGVAVEVAVGALLQAAFAPASFDVLVLHEQHSGSSEAAAADGDLVVLREVARLLRPSGRAYFALTNPHSLPTDTPAAQPPADASPTLARYGERFAAAGLRAAATYACFPDHARPRFFVPLALVDDFCRALPPGASDTNLTAFYASLAGKGIARDFAPSFAFIVQPTNS